MARRIVLRLAVLFALLSYSLSTICLVCELCGIYRVTVFRQTTGGSLGIYYRGEGTFERCPECGEVSGNVPVG